MKPEELIILVTVLASVLQIILFFKIWGMTNDVSKIKSRIKTENDDMLICKAIAKNDPDLADILFDALFCEMYSSIYSETPIYEITNKYKKLYDKANLVFPKQFSNINREAFIRDFTNL